MSVTVEAVISSEYGYGPFNASPWGRRDHRPVTAAEWQRIANHRRRVRRPVGITGAPPPRLADGRTVAEALESRR